jgi:hypothetical protein
MSDPNEPAVPIVAALPMQAYEDLFHLAKAEIGGLAGTGVRVAWDFTEAEGVNVRAVATVMHVKGGKVDAGVQVKFHGRPVSYGGFIQWTREE